jgi:hypothetical protein
MMNTILESVSNFNSLIITYHHFSVPETPSPPIEKESTPHNNQMFLLNTNFSSFSPRGGNAEEVETPVSNQTVKTSLDITHRSDDSNGTFEQTRVSTSLVPADPEQSVKV